jgi:hypothetical protein
VVITPGSLCSVHSPATPGSVTCTWIDRPSGSALSRWSLPSQAMLDISISHSSMPSAASTGSSSVGWPTATSASARCTAVSWAIRRSQNSDGWAPSKVHTGSLPASATTPVSRFAPARSHSPRSAGSAGNLPSGTSRKGIGC